MSKTFIIMNFTVEEIITTISSSTVHRSTKPITTRVSSRPTRPTPTYTTKTVSHETESSSVTEQLKPTKKVYTRPSTTEADVTKSGSAHVPQIIIASHPQEKPAIGSHNNIASDQTPRVNIPLTVDGERRESLGAKLNLGAIIALGAFGGFVFLAAIITTIVILVRR